MGAEIDRLRDKREVVNKRAANFERHLSAWEKGSFVKQEDDFLTLRRELDSQLPRMEGKIAELDEKIVEVSYQLKKANERVDTLEDERNYLLEANTNVPPELARLRVSLASALDRDIAELPFVAELIQVLPDELKWVGPIGRAMRSFALTIVVPPKLADEAEKFLEETHLADRLALSAQGSGHSKIKPDDDSLLAKLVIRSEIEKSRQAWLKWEINRRFPHLCLEERNKKFDDISDAITLEGLVKTGGSLREKDDTFFMVDASTWVLSWDLSPKQKSLDEKHREMERESENAGRSIRESEFERQTLRAKLRAGVQLQACANEFSDIDVLGLSTRMADLEEEEERNCGRVRCSQKIERRCDALVEKLDSLQNTRDQILQRIGGVEARAERNETRIEAIRTLVEKYRAELIPELTEEEDPEEANRRQKWMRQRRNFTLK